MLRRPALVMSVAGAVAALAVASAAAPVSAGTAKVLRVGSWKGVAGTFASIQAAVDAARPVRPMRWM